MRDRSDSTRFPPETANAAQVVAALRPQLDPEAVLCTDSAAIYHSFAKADGITHHRVNLRQKRRVDGAVHIRNVHVYHGRLKAWMRRFHGEMTKYRVNYLGWRRLLERYGDDIKPLIRIRESLGSYPPQQLTQT
ncbi:IS1595 family transposase [Pseudomonas sp. BN102]|nr:IS1595 family transposase [Pseudomonas sp. BN102]